MGSETSKTDQMAKCCSFSVNLLIVQIFYRENNSIDMKICIEKYLKLIASIKNRTLKIIKTGNAETFFEGIDKFLCLIQRYVR